MLSDKVCFVDTLFCNENKICDSTRDLFQCKNFYILMERFCNTLSKEIEYFDRFLNEFFNDEGYVDIWRIPHLMLDIYNCNFWFHTRTLRNKDFIENFPRFLGLFYNYYLSEYKPYLINEAGLNDIKKTVLQIKTNQNLMNLVMDSYSRIIENIEIYEKSAKEENTDAGSSSNDDSAE
ncbi:MAG: hypothetical protein ACYCX2_03925 [Christensenellales bacterium]